jgi:hypothetical protein
VFPQVELGLGRHKSPIWWRALAFDTLPARSFASTVRLVLHGGRDLDAELIQIVPGDIDMDPFIAGVPRCSCSGERANLTAPSNLQFQRKSLCFNTRCTPPNGWSCGWLDLQEQESLSLLHPMGVQQASLHGIGAGSKSTTHSG